MPRVTDERVAELTDQLENGVKELYASGRYEEYLCMMSKFHQYSVGNVMLIYLQCPHATQVAGYRRWKEKFGRQVKRGEKGIRILAPCPYKHLMEQEQAGPEDDQQEDTHTVKLRFKVATVFDVSQTEGRELPTLGVGELTGDVPGYGELYVRLAAYSPVPIETEPIPGKAKGYFSAREQRIVLRPGMSQVQTLKTLVHEIAHAKLHDPDRGKPEEQKGRGEKEVEAESVAFVVCQHFGINTSDYSFGYVAGWSEGKELAELKASLDTIRATAAEIINIIQPPEREAPETVRHQAVPSR